MDISAINSGLSAGGLLKGRGPANNSFSSATAAAEAASFEAVLKDLQKKAKVTASHVVNEAAKSQQDKELKEACKGFEAHDFGNAHTLCFFYDSLCKRVFAFGFKSRSVCEQLVPGNTAWDNIRNIGLALGDRSRLVECGYVCSAHSFK